MGKEAARMVIDTGAHVGPIMSGSKNVLIGGFLAACKGDALTCSSHGQASIVEGSKTVLINGRPAARKGDKTSCGTPPTPPAIGPKPVEKEYNFVTPNKTNRADGNAVTSVDYVDTKVLNAYANFEDKYGEGKHNYMESGAVLSEFYMKGDGYIGPENNPHFNLKGGGGFSVGKAEVKGGSYDGSNGVFGAEAEGKASVLSAKADIGVGDAYSSASANVSGDVLYAEAKAETVTFRGGSSQRYGFQGEVSADAGAAKADGGGDFNLLGIVKAKSKFGISGGSAAIGGKGGAYIDIDDYEVGANLGGKVALAVGLNIDLELSLSIKPIVDLFFDEYVSVTPMPGVIISGCSNVLIGG